MSEFGRSLLKTAWMLKISKPYREGSQINVIYTSITGFAFQSSKGLFIQQAKTFRLERLVKMKSLPLNYCLVV